MSDRFTDEQRFELWRAFAGGDTPQYFSGFQDQHWTAGVDRLADVLAPMLDGEYEKLHNENKQLRAEIAAGRAVLTDRIAKWKAEQEQWQNMPTSAMDSADWLAAEFQQARLGEVEDLLDKFDAATTR